MEDTELDRKRPLEVRLRVAGVTPGFEDWTTEREALRFGRSSADVAVILRGIFEAEKLNVGVLAVNGHTAVDGAVMPPSALFHLWMSFTGYVARLQADEDDTQGAQQINFARKVLTLLHLDEQMRSLSIPSSEESSTQASPASQSDPSGPSED